MTDVVREYPKQKFKRKYTRETAAKHLQAFLKRVSEYNTNPLMPFTLSEVVLFGSYRRGAEKVGDVDLVIVSQDKPDHQRLEDARVDAYFVERGQNLYGLDDLFWPHREMMLFIKARSPVLSLHGRADLELALAEGGVYVVRAGQPITFGALSRELGLPHADNSRQSAGISDNKSGNA